MFKKLAKLITGDPNERAIKRMTEVVDQINAMEPRYETLDDSQLQAKTTEFKARLSDGETLDQLLPEAFAAVREASKRVLGMRHYDVQLMCGINLHEGNISELRTGEGKTLAATLPLYLNALEGGGAHLITVNDYLARRDGRWMGAIYHKLGLSVGVLQSAGSGTEEKAFLYDPEERSLREETNQLRPIRRKQAYLADITYGTNSEFGFDYLRDNIAMNWNERVQRGHHYAIIDEVDNILIDEARTPLIISGPAHEDSETYVRTAQVVRALVPEDFELDEKDRTVTLTELGISHVEDLLGEPLSDPERPEDITPEQARLMGFLEQALRAQYLFHRNKEYIVQGGEVIIVDEFTGRMMPGRRWSEGLHQAVEAKEGVKVHPENITYATITIQNYFRMYKKLAGMTGTAETEKEEFYRIYGLDVLPIPTNLDYRSSRQNSGLAQEEAKDEEGYKYTWYYNPADGSKTPLYFKRKDYPDVVYRNNEAKLRAIVREIVRFYAIGRPQLVGTTSVESSELLSERLGPESVRRLLQTELIRQAYFRANGLEGELGEPMAELDPLNEPLNQLRMPDLRKMGNQYGLTSMDLADESNQGLVRRALNLGTEDWERLKTVFDAGVPHQVLNARKHTEESLIIAGAGAFGAVTIATNMAGRGVDIKLGGELDETLLARINQILAQDPATDPYNMTLPQRLEALGALSGSLDEEQQAAVDKFVAYMEDMARVRELGGLHVIGSERHEARRIDNQLRGRAGRQGDPGSSRFFLAMDDELMRRFGGSNVEGIMGRFWTDANYPLEIGLVGKLVEQAQTRVEGYNFDSRKHLLEYDDVLNAQRQRIYTQRDRTFTKPDLREDVNEMLQTEITERVKAGLSEQDGARKLLDQLEEIQPSLISPWGAYPSYTYQLAQEKLEGATSADDLRARLRDLAEESIIEADRQSEISLNTLLDRTGEAMSSTIEMASANLDDYLETFDSSQPRDLNAELTVILKRSPRFTPSDRRAFLDDPMSMREPLMALLQTGVSEYLLRGLVRTLENRMRTTWSLDVPSLAELPWKEVAGVIRDEVMNALERRRETLLADGGEIDRDLDANRELLQQAVDVPEARLAILQGLTQGKVTTFDSKSHQRVTRTAQRLRYTHALAKPLQKQPAGQVSDAVLEHLTGAEDMLANTYGKVQLDYMEKQNLSLAEFSRSAEASLQHEFTEGDFLALRDKPLEELNAAQREKVSDTLGRAYQNFGYRRLLLGTITDQWVEYLTKMEALRVSVTMESYAQRDPLIQYKGQASTMFSELLSDVRQTVVSKMFHMPLPFMQPAQAAAGTAVSAQPAAAETAPQTAQQQGGKKKKKARRRH